VGPEEVHENDQRAETSLLRKKGERLRVVLPGKEKVTRRLYCSLSVLKRLIRRMETFYQDL